MRKRSLFYFLCGLVYCSLIHTVPAYAGWEQYEEGWKYRDKETKEYVVDGWKWIHDDDTNTDYCYYFENGYLLTDTTTPDGYKVDSNGRWEQGPNYLTQEEFVSKYGNFIKDFSKYVQVNDPLSVLKVMGKSTYARMIDVLPTESFVKMVSDTKGIYICKEHLYYGDIKDGKAEGNGMMYRRMKKNWYGYFTGEWHNGAPNGPGEERIYKNGNWIVNIGNYVDWYQDGDMTSILYLNREQNNQRTFRFSVVNRIPILIDCDHSIVAFAEENPNAYVTFYGIPQPVLSDTINNNGERNGYYYGNQ